MTTYSTQFGLVEPENLIVVIPQQTLKTKTFITSEAQAASIGLAGVLHIQEALHHLNHGCSFISADSIDGVIDGLGNSGTLMVFKIANSMMTDKLIDILTNKTYPNLNFIVDTQH